MPSLNNDFDRTAGTRGTEINTRIIPNHLQVVGYYYAKIAY